MTGLVTPDRTDQDAEYDKKGNKALRGAMFAFFVDMYDVYLPVIALAPAISYFMPADATAVEMATISALIFAVSLVGRPLGALVFGPLGDKIGRRRTTTIAAGGFTICTGLIAVLPGHATIGLAAPAVLIALRLLDGLFLGGEYTAANPLAMEYAPRKRRGLYGGLLHLGYPGALAAITVITMVTLQVFDAGGPESAYSVWGWRIPFIIGFLLSAVVFFEYLHSVPESEIWTKMVKADNPLRTLFSRRNARSLGLAFVVGTGAWLTLNGSVGVFSSHFKKLGTPVGTLNTTVLIMAVLSMCAFPFVGEAAQRFGRGRVIAVLGLANIVIGAPAFGFAVTSSGSHASVILMGLLALLPSTLIWAVITPFIIELFPAQIRSSGYGIAYSFPSIIPAFYSYYMLWLTPLVPYDYTPMVFTVLGGAFLVVGAALSSDLRHTHLDAG